MITPKPARRFLSTLPALLALLLGLALRLHGLAAQSFWNDEGNTARLVERPLALLIEGAAGDIHPPGYYLLLSAWRSLAGDSEFALRWYSTACAVLSVALGAALGKRVGGQLGETLAAFGLAFNPLSVYYSQEARMYAQLGLAAAFTLWAGARLVSQAPAGGLKTRRAWVWLLAGAIAFGLYTQYSYIFALVGLNAGFVLHWISDRTRRWRTVWAWALAHLLAGAAFLPWAPIALRAGGWQPPDLGSAGALRALIQAIAVGVTHPRLPGAYVVGGAIALTALAALRSVRQRFVKWAVLAMAWTPILFIVALRAYRDAYLKFMIVALVPWALMPAVLVGSGHSVGRRITTRAWRAAAVGVLLSLLPLQLRSLVHLYRDPLYSRDDYRGIAAWIADEGRAGDAILLNAPNQWEVFTYYYRGPLPVYPAPYRPGSDSAAAWLEPILDHHQRLYVLYWGDVESDPQRWIEALLARQAYKVGDSWRGNIRIARYGVSALPESPAMQVGAAVGQAIRLEGYALPARNYAPGDVVPLTLFWIARDPVAERYKVFVHLLNAEGVLVAQNDSEPGGGFALTTGWEVGERQVDRYGLLLPNDLPPGDYALWVGMYGFSSERLQISLPGQADADALKLTAISVRSAQ